MGWLRTSRHEAAQFRHGSCNAVACGDPRQRSLEDLPERIGGHVNSGIEQKLSDSPTRIEPSTDGWQYVRADQIGRHGVLAGDQAKFDMRDFG